MTFKIINADDFGISDETNKIIIELLENRVINGTSVLLTAPLLSSPSLQILKEMEDKFIGLHLYLTEMNGKTLGRILFELLTGKLRISKIERIFEEQIQTFIQTFNRLPTHIDSHQHVHQLPIVRMALTKALLKTGCTTPIIRNSDSPLFFCFKNFSLFGIRSIFKNLYLSLIGKSYKRYLRRNSLITNRYLLGTYAFTDRVSYKSIYQCFTLFQYNQEDIYYCHPGGGNDSIGNIRLNEYCSLKQ